MNQKDQEYIFNTQGIKVLYRRPMEHGWSVKELQYLHFWKKLNTTKDLK